MEQYQNTTNKKALWKAKITKQFKKWYNLNTNEKL